MWYLDSGCSRHMTGNISLFIDFVPKKNGFVTYGDNKKGAILGKGSVDNPPSTTNFDVMFVDGLKHNLLSISQLFDKGFKVTLTNTYYLFEHNEKNNCLFKGLRVNNSYMLNLDDVSLVDNIPLTWITSKDHPIDNILGDITRGITTCFKISNFCYHFTFVSQVEPKNAKDALLDDHWIVEMQDELNQFKRNDVWDVVPCPKYHQVIGTRWVFRNKLDEDGVITRNKARLVTQWYNQDEGVDYEETYAPVARLEVIHLLLAFDCSKIFKLFQMDVKSVFLNGYINE
ncbi:uncharacterized protein LOC127136021 [Lathyrus oleraceus]|uniref:uncharacterized protein LOC127136021 n=1 Tax=Pisum sativum TaxID=3888 RepID=UPI0021D1389B|nr:uncharacterized protein LOC127136021 [Pisum sativum]